MGGFISQVSENKAINAVPTYIFQPLKESIALLQACNLNPVDILEGLNKVNFVIDETETAVFISHSTLNEKFPFLNRDLQNHAVGINNIGECQKINNTAYSYYIMKMPTAVFESILITYKYYCSDL